MSEIPFIDDQYIDSIIKATDVYHPELNETQGVKLRELVKKIRDRVELNSSPVTGPGRLAFVDENQQLTGDANLQWNKSSRRLTLGGQSQGIRFNNSYSRKAMDVGFLFDGSQIFEVKNATDNFSAFRVSVPISNSMQAMVSIGERPPGNKTSDLLFIYGGQDGATMTMRGNREKLDLASLNLEGETPQDGNPSGMLLTYSGVPAAMPLYKLGYPADKLGYLEWYGHKTAIIHSYNNAGVAIPIRFGLNDIEIANVNDKGLAYQTDFSAVNADNPRWLTDKNYVDSKVDQAGKMLKFTTSGDGIVTGFTFSHGLSTATNVIIFPNSNDAMGLKGDLSANIYAYISGPNVVIAQAGNTHPFKAGTNNLSWTVLVH